MGSLGGRESSMASITLCGFFTLPNVLGSELTDNDTENQSSHSANVLSPFSLKTLHIDKGIDFVFHEMLNCEKMKINRG